MPNFYTDNPDIPFCIGQLNMDRAVKLREDDFADAKTYSYAPQDTAEAQAQYDEILKLAGDISGNFVAPRAKVVDKEGNEYRDGKVILHPELQASIKRFAGADLMGLSIARRYGGLNLPNVIKTAVIEMIARADASLMNIVGLQDIAETIEEFGDEEMKQDALPRLCAGEDTAAMVLTEPDAGSDLQSVRLRAEPVDEAKGLWKLSGIKRFITNGCGEVLLVLARSEPNTAGARGLSVFLVRKSDAVRIRRIEDKLGIHGSPTCEIQFNAAPGKLLGQRKRGLTDVGLAIMNGARVAIAAQGLGLAEAAYRAARDYSQSRVQFGRPIRQIPAVYDLLAQMRIRIEAARALTYHAADVVEQLKASERGVGSGEKNPADFKAELKRLTRLATVLTPLTKLYATEIANSVASDAIQVLGGSGFMKDYPVERYFRDARITNIYEGTTQLQVVGAIGGIRSGVLRANLDGLLREAKGNEFAAQVTALLPELNQSLAIAAANDADVEFNDLYARWIVALGLDLYLGALLALQAGTGNERKIALAEAFFAEMPLRAKMTAGYINQASRAVIAGQKIIIG
ncbi:MAG: acyl-CoA dehydrogenase family protein [Planctomycetota bacterium]